MSITRVGATEQYSNNWDNIFGDGKARSSAASKTSKLAKPSAKRKPAKKKVTPIKSRARK